MSLKYYPDHIYIENLMEKQEQHIVGNKQYIGYQSNYPQDKITPPDFLQRIDIQLLIYATRAAVENIAKSLPNEKP